MLIATHAEEFVKQVDATQISFLTPYGVRKVPQRFEGQVPDLHVWPHRHVESYLLFPKAWKRAAGTAALERFPLADGRADAVVDAFFSEQGFAENEICAFPRPSDSVRSTP